MKDLQELHRELADAAYELACQRAREEGDVDPDYDYPLMEAWFDEYYIELCHEEGIQPSPDYVDLDD